MTWSTLCVLLCLLGVGHGQVYVLLITGQIREYALTGGSAVKTWNLTTMDNGGGIAYDGNSELIYYGDTMSVYELDPNTDAISKILTETEAVMDVDVCCGLIYYVVNTADGAAIKLATADGSTRKTLLIVDLVTTTAVRISVDCPNSIIYYNVDDTIYYYDLTTENITNVGQITNFDARGSSVGSLSYADGFVYVAPDSGRFLYQVDVSTGLTDDQRDNGIISYTRLSAGNESLFYGAVKSVGSGTTNLVERDSITGFGGFGNGLGTLFANAGNEQLGGMYACGTDRCQTVAECPAADCSATLCNGCGFCVSNGTANGGVCTCQTPGEPGCSFDTAPPASCAANELPLDMNCVITPMAQRRSGIVTVYDYLGPGIPGSYGTLLRRKAKTGRWCELPDTITTSPFEFPTTNMQRGKRFGAMVVSALDAGSVIVEQAICIVQENSRFFSTAYSTLLRPSEDVTLQSYCPPGRRSNLRWSRTDITASDYVDLIGGSCDGVTAREQFSTNSGEKDWTLTYTAANFPSTEYIYEVYVEPRYLRSWHPIWHVMVNRCERGKWGDFCNETCVACDMAGGECDPASGLCMCFPGYTGASCNAMCTTGFVGRNCEIDCETDYGAPDCRGILIGLPYPIGSRCAYNYAGPSCYCPAGERWNGSTCEACPCNTAGMRYCMPDGTCAPDYVTY